MAGRACSVGAGPWDLAMSADHSASSEQHLGLHGGDLLTITDAIPIDVTVLAADGTVLYVNQFALNRLELNAHEVNIRELQNVVERAVILCEADTFVVGESWLESESEESSQGDGLRHWGNVKWK